MFATYRPVFMVTLVLADLEKLVGPERIMFMAEATDTMLGPWEHPEFPGIMYNSEARTARLICKDEDSAKYVADSWRQFVTEVMEQEAARDNKTKTEPEA